MDFNIIDGIFEPQILVKSKKKEKKIIPDKIKGKISGTTTLNPIIFKR